MSGPGFVARTSGTPAQAELVGQGLDAVSDVVPDEVHALVALDAAIARGLADADAGRTYPIEEVEARLTSKYKKMAEER